jgi:predicted HTH domain antitoxin
MQLTLSIPDELAADFHSEDDLKRALYEDFIIAQRQAGVISLGRAAELLDLSYQEFFALLGQKGLSFINASTEEMLEEAWQPRTDLGQRLLDLRRAYVKDGGRLLDPEELDEELRERRGSDV